MSGTRFEQEGDHRFVTQAEAAEMIELWTRTMDNRSGDLVDFRDVVEALHISESEGERLLASVRGQVVEEKGQPRTILSMALYSALAVSIGLCLIVSGLMLSGVLHGQQLNPGWSMAFLVMIAWSAGWIAYSRRPLIRFVRRIADGRP